MEDLEVMFYRWTIRVRLGWNRLPVFSQHFLFWSYFLLCTSIIWSS